MGNHKTTSPVIALHCPQEAPQPEALCQAMIAALTEASPAREIHTPDPAEAGQVRPDDLEITLRLDGVSQNRISGHLEWRKGASDDLHSGPRVDIDVMDATLSPAFYAQFANGLIRATPQLLSE